MDNLALQWSSKPAERLEGGRVKGSMIRAHVEWVREHASREEAIELFEALSPEVRQQVATVLTGSWYEFSTLIAFDRAILSLLGRNDLRFLEQLGSFSARTNLSGVYRSFQREEVHEFFRRSAMLHRQFQDFGSVEYEEDGDRAGMMRHRGYRSFSPLYCASAAGYYRECVARHGGWGVDVTELECHCTGASSCTFSITWQ